MKVHAGDDFKLCRKNSSELRDGIAIAKKKGRKAVMPLADSNQVPNPQPPEV